MRSDILAPVTIIIKPRCSVQFTLRKPVYLRPVRIDIQVEQPKANGKYIWLDRTDRVDHSMKSLASKTAPAMAMRLFSSLPNWLFARMSCRNSADCITKSRMK